MLKQNHLSENLLFLREAAGLKQADIQERLGIIRNTWSNWENGKAEPGLETLLKIAHFFDIDVGKMITERLSQQEGLTITIPDNDDSSVVKEPDGDEYGKKSCSSCDTKDNIISIQKETIKALQGQVEILQVIAAKILRQEQQSGTRRKKEA